ncbi:nuclear pore complex protein NUP1-like [Prosopis cineraria]|uniref:nuclear pore complex protein NUP1-like n=1 Tax=Prosopis cineraria TaxID=364024 RepID=UPI0024105D97|nr:nuclear pore complex protein NUP1-like [Prosopis cineraria]
MLSLLQDGTTKSAETESTGERYNKLSSSCDLVLHNTDEKGEQSENNNLSEMITGKREKIFEDGTTNQLKQKVLVKRYNKLSSSCDLVLHKQDEKGEQSENNKLSEIEQLVKGKRFSRDEVHHLMEIINLRASELPNVVQGEENASLTVRNDNKGIVVSHDDPNISNEQKHEDLTGALWGSSTRLDRSKVQDDIGASPVEIAKAYMGSRAFEVGPSSKSTVHTVESGMLHGNEAAIKPYVPSLSPKTSACWPGVMVQDSYTTPLSQSRGYGLHNFPRTPYSRTILSNPSPGQFKCKAITVICHQLPSINHRLLCICRAGHPWPWHTIHSKNMRMTTSCGFVSRGV